MGTSADVLRDIRNLPNRTSSSCDVEKRENCDRTKRFIGPTADEPQKIRNLQNRAAYFCEGGKRENCDRTKRLMGPRDDEPQETRNLPTRLVKWSVTVTGKRSLDADERSDQYSKRIMGSQGR